MKTLPVGARPWKTKGCSADTDMILIIITKPHFHLIFQEFSVTMKTEKNIVKLSVVVPFQPEVKVVPANRWGIVPVTSVVTSFRNEKNDTRLP